MSAITLLSLSLQDKIIVSNVLIETALEDLKKNLIKIAFVSKAFSLYPKCNPFAFQENISEIYVERQSIRPACIQALNTR